MTSKFLERFKANINAKNSIFSPSIPISKSLNPSHLHSIQGYKRKIMPSLEPMGQNEETSEKIRNIKKSPNTPVPVSESSLSNRPRLLPEIRNYHIKSKNSMRNKSVNKSYAQSPINFEEIIKANKLMRKKIGLEKSKQEKYLVLGGLGPNLGGDDWRRAVEKKKKMSNYWKIIKQKNFSIG